MEKIVELNEGYFRDLFGNLVQFDDLKNNAKLPNPGLRSFLSRTIMGNDEVYTTPWIDAKDTPEILKEASKLLAEWMPHLDKLESPWPTLYKFEKDLAAKVGPLSTQASLSERAESVNAYYKGILMPADPIAQEAINAVLVEYNSARGTAPRSPSNTLNKMKKSTISGLPLYQKKRLVADKTLNSKFGHVGYGDKDLYLEIFNQGTPNMDIFYIAAILGWRGQEGGMDDDDVKQRVVWMFPFKVNIKELCVYQPLIEVFQNFKLMPAYVSMEAVDDGITKLFDTKGPDDLIICTDFEKFDQHFNESLQNAAKSILSSLLNNSVDSKRWIEDIFPIKYNIPLLVGVTNDGEAAMLYGKHGMGSGSGGTNFDESLAHRALQYEAALNNGAALNPYSQCHGDDGILSFPGITKELVTEAYTKHGLVMNLGKQYDSAHDCVYLRRWHHENYRVDGKCVGVYSTARALGRLMFQERYMDPEEYPKPLDRAKMIALRELSIIENCKHHPLFEEFADFCMKRDKFRLGLDIPGFLDNVDNYARLASAYMPDFLGYTKSLQAERNKGAQSLGLSGWRIVKYLKSK